MHADPKGKEIQPSCQHLLALLGSAQTKALCKMLMKLTPCDKNFNLVAFNHEP